MKVIFTATVGPRRPDEHDPPRVYTGTIDEIRRQAASEVAVNGCDEEVDALLEAFDEAADDPDGVGEYIDMDGAMSIRVTLRTSHWSVGDTYYAACGMRHGRPADLGELGEECETPEEAAENAELWLGDLTESERKYADTYVQRFRVTSLNESGDIGAAHSF